MPTRKKNYIGSKSIRSKRVRMARQEESTEARVKRLSAIRLRASIMRAEENEEARAMRQKRDRENMARKRVNKAAAEATAHRAAVFRQLLSAQNTDSNEELETENIDVDSEFPYEIIVKCEINADDELDTIESSET